MTTIPSSIPKRRFWIPLLIQTLLIASVPAQALYTHVTGTTVVLKTVPVDPYDFMRGYSVTLNYDISRAETLKKLPGGKNLSALTPNYTDRLTSQEIYVTLQKPTKATNPPQPWKPISVSTTLPQNLPANQIAIKGRSDYGQVSYGVETYYMPESRRDEVNDAIAKAGRTAKPAVVEVKVDTKGQASPTSIWVFQKQYEF